jgi:hypothetical protein
MLKKRQMRTGFIVGVNVVFMLLAVINVLEIVDILFFNDHYPLEGVTSKGYSIYQSKGVYIVFKVVSIILALAMFVFTFTKRWEWLFWILAAVNVLLLLYSFVSV